MSPYHPFGRAAFTAEKLAQFGVGNGNLEVLSNGSGDHADLVAQTLEFSIGEISEDSPNSSFVK
jgi:hypothetical protein